MKRFILFMVLLSIPFVSAYEENIKEGIFLVRPENEYIIEQTLPTYLEQEDLIFFACLEQENTPVRLSVVCLDNNIFQDIAATRWGTENCYIGSTNLEPLDCTSAVIQAEYTSGNENLKLEQQIRINKFSHTLERILQTQFEDGGWQTPLDTAHGLLVLQNYPELFPERINQALEYLKINRDDIQKCWPRAECRVSTTAAILFLLDQAGFEDLRIQHDGAIYLENTQYFLTGENWTVQIQDHPVNLNNTIDTSCVYDYDGSITTVELERSPAETTYSMIPEHYNVVNVVCTEPVLVEVHDEFDETLIAYAGDNFTYEIPAPCWTKNDENVNCDLRATLYSASLPLTSSRVSVAKTYLATQVQTDRLAGSFVSDDDEYSLINDALYLMADGGSASQIQTHLLYSQTNNGSWQDNNTYYQYGPYEYSLTEYRELQARIDNVISRHFITTGYVLMALLDEGFERDEEVILDAERWVSLHEDSLGLNISDADLQDAELAEAFNENKSEILNDTKRNALAHFVLKNNARPLLLAEPQIVRTGPEPIIVDIVNPTIFELDNLEYELSDDIQGLVEVDEKDYIGAYSFRRITITRREGNERSAIGYLRILNEGNEYLKLPIVVRDVPELNITLPARVTAFGSTSVLPFTVMQSGHEFSCTIEWSTPGISSNSAFDITNVTDVYSYPVRFNSIETENKIYEGEITCISQQITYIIPVATNIVRFPTKPVAVNPSVLTYTISEEQQVTITNRLDEAIEVEISLDQPDPLIVLEDSSLTLFPGEARNVSVEVVSGNDNYTTTNRLIVSSYDIEERILIDIALTNEAPANTPWWLIAAIAGALLLIVGGLGWYGYSKREKLLEWYQNKFKKEDIQAQVTQKVEEIEREEELVTIKNMINILKLRGSNETEVRKRLLSEGYLEEDIDAALAYQAPKEDAETPSEAQ